MFEVTTLTMQLTHLTVQKSLQSEPEMSGVNRSRSVMRYFFCVFSDSTLTLRAGTLRSSQISLVRMKSSTKILGPIPFVGFLI